MNFITSFIELGFSLSLIINAFLFIPQIITLLKTKSAENVSLLTFGGFNIIQVLIVAHGLLNQDYLLAFGFSLTFLTCGTVSALIIYYKYLKKPCFIPS